MVESATTRVLIDCGPDFRQQMLAAGSPRIDAIVLTHSHMDHVMGLDDTRSLTMRDRPPMKVYGDAATLEALKRVYKYAFERVDERQALPRWELVQIDGPFGVGDLTFTPHELPHFPAATLGFEVAVAGAPARLCYATDCHVILPETLARFRGCEVLVLDMLRERKHVSHLSLAEALAIAAEVGAGRTLFVHMNHEISHAALSARLPAGVELGADGLRVEV